MKHRNLTCEEAWKAEGTTAEWEAAITALMLLRYNHSVQDAMRLAYGSDVYDDPHRNAYAKIKEKVWQACPLSFFARLDPNNRTAFVEGLRRVYEGEARSKVRPKPGDQDRIKELEAEVERLLVLTDSAKRRAAEDAKTSAHLAAEDAKDLARLEAEVARLRGWIDAALDEEDPAGRG